MVAVLAGGTGGAKLARGLLEEIGPSELAVIANTGDDVEVHGLHVSPDPDLVLYWLAGLIDERGWGIRGDTWKVMEALEAAGRPTWFRLGDRDFATHILRTERLRGGASLTAVMTELAAALGVRTRLLPMTDDPVATLVDTPAGRLGFQDYFVARRQEDDVLGVVFDGVDAARLPADVAAAITAAEVIVLCPSNPIVSVGPILAVPGMRQVLTDAEGPIVAVSPIVGGRALKGPADRMLATLGHEVSAVGVAALYVGLVDGLVIDEADRALAPRIEALGIAVLVAPTVMGGADDRRRLAEQTLAFARGLAAVGSGAS